MRLVRTTATGLVLLVALSVGACSGGSDGDEPERAEPSDERPVDPGAPASVEVSDLPSLGRVLVDGQGRTLYLFTRDTGSTSTCTGSCAELWPPVEAGAGGEPTAGDGVDGSKLGSTTRDDGSQQVTYAGHPLYRYGQDEKPGDAKGHGVGSVWYVVDGNGNAVTTSAATSGVPSY
jgi:predicted lipoprotein with Yx(FWY)xxD motif